MSTKYLRRPVPRAQGNSLMVKLMLLSSCESVEFEQADNHQGEAVSSGKADPEARVGYEYRRLDG